MKTVNECECESVSVDEDTERRKIMLKCYRTIPIMKQKYVWDIWTRWNHVAPKWIHTILANEAQDEEKKKKNDDFWDEFPEINKLI